MVNNSHGLTDKMTVVLLLSAAVFFISGVPAIAGSPEDFNLDNVISTGSAVLKSAGIAFSFNGAAQGAVAASKAAASVTTNIIQGVQGGSAIAVPSGGGPVVGSPTAAAALLQNNEMIISPEKILQNVMPYVPQVGSASYTVSLGPVCGPARLATDVIQNNEAVIAARDAIVGKVVETGAGIVSAMPAPVPQMAQGMVHTGQDVTAGVLAYGIVSCNNDLVPREIKNLWVGGSIDVYGSDALRYDQRTEGMSLVSAFERVSSDGDVKDYIVEKTGSNKGLVNDKNRAIWNDHGVLVMEDGENDPAVRQGVDQAFDLIPDEHKPKEDMLVISIQQMPEEYKSIDPKTQELITYAGVHDPGKNSLIVLNRDNADDPNVKENPLLNAYVVTHEYGHFYADNYQKGQEAQDIMRYLHYDRVDSDKPDSYSEEYGQTNEYEDFATMYADWMVDTNSLLAKGQFSRDVNRNPILLEKCDLMQYVFSGNNGNQTQINVYDYNGKTVNQRMAAPIDMLNRKTQNADSSNISPTP